MEFPKVRIGELDCFTGRVSVYTVLVLSIMGYLFTVQSSWVERIDGGSISLCLCLLSSSQVPEQPGQ